MRVGTGCNSSVTLATTAGSPGDLAELADLARLWGGPVSVAVHAPAQNYVKIVKVISNVIFYNLNNTTFRIVVPHRFQKKFFLYSLLRNQGML